MDWNADYYQKLASDLTTWFVLSNLLTRYDGVARLRMPQLRQNSDRAAKAEEIMDSEYKTICLVEKESKIPVPHVHMFEADSNSHVGAQFMLMNCLQGNAGIDLSLNIPSEHKSDVYTRMAEIQVCNYTINRPLF